jgi:hypothetical protein
MHIQCSQLLTIERTYVQLCSCVSTYTLYVYAMLQAHGYWGQHAVSVRAFCAQIADKSTTTSVTPAATDDNAATASSELQQQLTPEQEQQHG